MIKVAFDIGLLATGNSFRGIGVHTKELINAFKKINPKDVSLDFVDFNTTDLSKYDLAHFQFFHPHFLTLPFFKKTKYVVTIHDLIRLIYPKAYPPGFFGTLRFWIQKFNLRNVDAVITISETSKKDIVRLLGIPSNKIFVTYLAPQSMSEGELSEKSLLAVKQKYNLPSQYVLYVGDVNYNKNLLNLAEACKISKVKLVIVGKQAVSEVTDGNIENNSWQKFLKKYKHDPSVIRLGYLENLEFAAIYKLASLYFQPSLYEGFGLPILEAMVRNCPVIAARNQAHVEIAEGACLFADPADPTDMSKKINQVLDSSNLQKDLIAKGRKILSKYSWEKTARETLGVYANTVKNNG